MAGCAWGTLSVCDLGRLASRPAAGRGLETDMGLKHESPNKSKGLFSTSGKTCRVCFSFREFAPGRAFPVLSLFSTREAETRRQGDGSHATPHLSCDGPGWSLLAAGAEHVALSLVRDSDSRGDGGRHSSCEPKPRARSLDSDADAPLFGGDTSNLLRDCE